MTSSSARSSKSTFEHFVESDESPTKGSLKKRKSRGFFNSFRRKSSGTHHADQESALVTSPPAGAVAFPAGDSEDSTSMSSSQHHERNRVTSMFKKLAPSKSVSVPVCQV